jgi:hypothetical protein
MTAAGDMRGGWSMTDDPVTDEDAIEAAYGVMAAATDMPFMAHSRDYYGDEVLRAADREADAKNREFVGRVLAAALPFLERAVRDKAVAEIQALPRRKDDPEWQRGSAVAQAIGYDIGLAAATDAIRVARRRGGDGMSYDDEGESERFGLGIDGTMGDAQDVNHPFIGSVYGDYCAVCGLTRSYKRHTAVGGEATE